LAQLFQQYCQLTSCQDISGTDQQGILKPTDSCDPFLARRTEPKCWWVHRAFGFHRHIHAPVLYDPMKIIGFSWVDRCLADSAITSSTGARTRTPARTFSIMGSFPAFLLGRPLDLRSNDRGTHRNNAWKVPQNEWAFQRAHGDENPGLTTCAYGSRQMVWQLLKLSLQYLQIDALRERVASTVLAVTRCDRAPEGQSGVLTCARVANEHQSKASVQRVRVSV